mmetsp:Transcript_21881/g.33946  ORF Transcript_21881/g.33946 Transcript_21881/m.33946 type:complete len:104 (+) Transcript_21881:122-433(+)
MAKEAIRLIKRKLSPNCPQKSIFLALTIVDVIMQKCGQPVVIQVVSKEFMNLIIALIRNDELIPQIKNKCLNLIEIWALKYQKEQDIYPLFNQIYNAFKAKGF